MRWRVVVHEDEAALAEAAAGQLVRIAAAAIAARGRFTVALAGGSTPAPLYELLGTPEWRERVPWLQAHLFWTDERFVPPADARSNYGTVRRALLTHLEIPPANVHPVPTFAGSPDEAAALYEETIRRLVGGDTAVPELDLLLLGLGEDGHTASLFPRSGLLRVEDRLVAADPVTRAGTSRVTMTFPLLNASRLALFLVSGSSKAAVLRDVLAGEDDPDRLPAQRVQPRNGVLECHLDRAAATGLAPSVSAGTTTAAEDRQEVEIAQPRRGRGAAPAAARPAAPTARPGLVFLFDVDNTLLDNDAVVRDFRAHLVREAGAEAAEHYWTLFEDLRRELGYADYLGALQRYRLDHFHDPRLLLVSSYLLDYPFAERLYPGALEVLARFGGLGLPVVFSDGDVVFQPRKIERSGIRRAVADRVLVHIHKERELECVERLFPATHYVLIDDKLPILTAVKRSWGPRVTTVFPRQGHYAHDPEILAGNPPADLSFAGIGELLDFDLPKLLGAASGGAAARRKVTGVDP